MIKKFILTFSVVIPNILWASINNNEYVTLKIDSASDSEKIIVEEIISKYPNMQSSEDQDSSNLIIQIKETPDKIEDLINKLKNTLGYSVKVERVSNSVMKIGTQDGRGWGK